MGIYVNPGNEGFQSALRSKIYVDKTGILDYMNSVMDSEQRYICVSRPRRFGKSMTAAMIAAYYGKGCDSRELFQGLQIAGTDEYEKHLNRYDIIHLDIAFIRSQLGNAMDTVCYIHKCVIEELKELYPGIVKDSESSLPMVLSKINNQNDAKFVIIIDEWDVIFREDRKDIDAQKTYIELLRGLFKGEPSKKYVKLAYITGILPIKKYGKESALNNFDEFTMTNPRVLSEYVGFTENEVKNLCDEYCMDFDEMARWYDGYSFRRVKHVYNPNSVVKAILSDDYDCYWSKTETYESLKNYISMDYDGLKDGIIQLLAGGRCRVNTDTFENDMTSFESKDDVLTVLIHLGYLAYDKDSREVYIPNEEVRSSFANAIQKSTWIHVAGAINASEELLKATWQEDSEAVARGIERVHTAHTSILSYNDENSLSCVISIAYYSAMNEYVLIRELPAGEGYADIVFLPRKHSDKPAMIVELKWNQDSEGAIAQIKDRKYVQALEEYKGRLLLVGINYDKKNKKHSCIIEKWDK